MDTTTMDPTSQRTTTEDRLAAGPLGPGGPLVGPLALGTMTFGVETDEREARRQLDAFVAAGGGLVDTADVYGDGESERIIGRWLADRSAPDLPLVATKGRFAPPAGSTGASRRGLVRAVEASLGRLGRESIDLYLVHGWDRDVPLEETLDTLSSLVRAGKIHHLGWSNVTGWQLERIVTTAQRGGFVAPVVVQPQYNLLDRGIEWELLPCALDHGLAVTPWSPLGGGWLTGKYRRDERPVGETRLGEDPDRGVEAWDLRSTDRTWAVLDVVERVAAEVGRPWSHVAIAWLRSRPGVTSVLLGARTVGQLTENLAAADLVLPSEACDALTAVSRPGVPPYPYGVVADFCELDVWERLGT